MSTHTLKQMDYSILQQCMHCGMCLPDCPTFRETGHERNSPRGRISLMRAVADERLELDQAFAEEMSYCVGCMACTSACPAGVDYATLLETARAEVVRERPASLEVRFYRWLTMRTLFRHPRLLRLAGRLLHRIQQWGLDAWLVESGIAELLPKAMARNLEMSPTVLSRFSDERIAELTQAKAGKRYRVALLTGCVQDLAYADINEATAKVLAENGCEVHTPSLQSCCGSLHAHNGAPELAVDLAKRLIDTFPPEQYDAIISNAGGCGSHLRRYHKLLADDTNYAERALAWDQKLHDVHEWLDKIGLRTPTCEATGWRVTYHDSCHLAHGQGVRTQPRKLLQAIPGLELIALPQADYCCGSAGIYSATQPEQAQKLVQAKLAHIRATGADILATANPGCHLYIERSARLEGRPLQVCHPVSLLAEAYEREATDPPQSVEAI